MPTLDEHEFRRRSEASMESLKRSLLEAEADADFEVEEQSGVLTLSFEDPPGKFVITPNAPVRQIWVSALSTSFKLDWSEPADSFVFSKTGEGLKALIGRLVNEQLGEQAVELS